MSANNNARRFFRQNLKVPFHFVKKEDSFDVIRASHDFYTLGMNYFSTKIEEELMYCHNVFTRSVEDLIHDDPTLKEDFYFLLQKIEFLNKGVKLIANGENPFKDPSFIFSYNTLAIRITSHADSGNQKTYDALLAYDEKATHFIEFLKIVCEKSTIKQLYSEDFPTAFEADHKTHVMKLVYKKNKSKLAKLFVSVSEYLDLTVKIFHNVVNDVSLCDKPDKWEVCEINLSSGGIAFQTDYHLEKGDQLDVYFRLDSVVDKEGLPVVISERAKIVRAEHFDGTEVGCILSGVKSETMDLIDAFILKYDIAQTMSYISSKDKSKVKAS